MNVTDTFGKIAPPIQLKNIGTGQQGINTLLSNIIGIFFSAAAIAFIIMFAWGTVQMILSGGDKEAIAKSRSKITWAIVGIVLMALSYFIFQLLEDITGFKFFTN